MAMEDKVIAKYTKRAGEIANGRKVKPQQNTVSKEDRGGRWLIQKFIIKLCKGK